MLSACGGATELLEPADAAVTPDTGLETTIDAARPGDRRDAGVSEDAGAPVVDAGTPTDGGTGPRDGGTGPTARTVTFIHINDLHANLIAHQELIRDPSSPDGFYVDLRAGAARLATVVAEIKAQNPASVAMNIGDTFHGGVEALYTNGEAIADVVDAIGFDIGVPGNWDFAFGPGVSWVRYVGADATPNLLTAQANEITQIGFENLAANVTVEADSTGNLPAVAARGLSRSLAAQDEQAWLPPTRLRTIGGVQVGFIGITSDIVPRMHVMLALGLEFLMGEAAYVDLVTQHAQSLRAQGAQIVVVMSELSIQKDLRIANVIAPGLVDVFFSAHTHELTEAPLESDSGALVVEAGNDSWVGQMDITVDDAGVVSGTQWTLHALDSSVPEDPTVAALVDAARAPFLGADFNVDVGDSLLPNPLSGRPLTRSIDTVIGHTDRILYRRNALESDFDNTFTDMLRAYAGTEIAISPGFRFEQPLLPTGWDVGNGVGASGEITLEQAYRYFPAPYTLATGEATVGHVHGVLEDLTTYVFSADVFQQGGGWVDGFSGFDASVDLTAADGQRVRSLTPWEGSADSSRAVTVAGCRRPFDEADTLCSHRGFSNVVDIVNPETSLAMTPVELFEWGLQQPSLPAARVSVTEISGTPMWPEAEYVQPLRGVQ